MPSKTETEPPLIYTRPDVLADLAYDKVMGSMIKSSGATKLTITLKYNLLQERRKGEVKKALKEKFNTVRDETKFKSVSMVTTSNPNENYISTIVTIVVKRWFVKRIN